VLETSIAPAEQIIPAINAIAHKQDEPARKAVAMEPRGGRTLSCLDFFETGEPTTFGRSLFKVFVRSRDRLNDPLQGRVSRSWAVARALVRAKPEYRATRSTAAPVTTSGSSNTRPGFVRWRPAAVFVAFCPWRTIDGGGSIRILTAQCGLFRLKLSRGRVSMAPDAGKGGVAHQSDTPLHWTADRLPIGVHFAVRYSEEGTLRAACAELETAQPWFNRASSR
jgi:amidase